MGEMKIKKIVLLWSLEESKCEASVGKKKETKKKEYGANGLVASNYY